jgi:stage V sporulation protein AD
MLYDLEKQKEVKAGGSGPVCSALVVYSYIFNLLKTKKIKRVLILATGALFSPLLVYQKENINTICHAVSLEAI